MEVNLMSVYCYFRIDKINMVMSIANLQTLNYSQVKAKQNWSTKNCPRINLSEY